MARSPEEQAQTERFSESYLCSQTPTMRAVERSVCGCDYGGSSWTTREETERLSALLELRPGRRLLDVGAGSGWPGLYMAGTSGCDIVLAAGSGSIRGGVRSALLTLALGAGSSTFGSELS